MNRTPELRKAAIGSHEPRQHRRDKLTRFADGLTGIACNGFRVGKQISMHGSWQFNADLDWFLVWKRPNLELSHFTLYMARERGRDLQSPARGTPDGWSASAEY